MNPTAPPAPPGVIVYPESDGQPMADNSKQFRWIQVLSGNLAALFRDRTDVLVAGNMLWYPEEGHPDLRAAPDVFVAFGRPKGDRRSYRQWEEDHVPLTVTFEVLSPSNDQFEMADKVAFYDEHGVEECYLYDPDSNRLAAYLRGGEALRRVWKVDGLVSPRLGIRFDLSGPEMAVFYPDGRRFLTFEALEAEREGAERRAEGAERRAEGAERRAEGAERRAERLAELTRRALAQQATPEELQELHQLLQPPGPPA
jgi:Uma2 family endonuclease